MVLGTLDYIAPEQIRGERIGPFTDVYALGAMIEHLLTGEVPFTVPTEEGKLWAHFSEAPPAPSSRVPELGPQFDPIVARAMSKRPEDRYASAGAVAVALEAALAEREAARRAAPAPRDPPPAPLPAPVPEALPPARPAPREDLVAALTDPFNVVLLGALLVAGAVLDTVGLMIPLALLVYAVGVHRSYRERRSAPPDGPGAHGDG